MTAASTVLCVDDEPNILAALARSFRRSGHRLLTADSGEAALALLEAEPVDLVISDMRMPRMDGAQLLETVRRRWPGTGRILLTGHADAASTVAAINRGEIFRYVAKPWSEDELLRATAEALERQSLLREKARLEEAVALHNEELSRLNGALESQVAERTAALSAARDRIDRNYLSSITALSSLIEMRGNAIAGHSRRVADLARRLAVALGMTEAAAQDVFVAGLLHDIGDVGLADDVLACAVGRMDATQKAAYARHPMLGEQALLALDDMQRVAALVRAHHERHDGQGFPDGLAGKQIALGARILALADTFDDLQSGHLSRSALTPAESRVFILRGRGTQFDPAVVDAFELLQAAPGPPNRCMEVCVHKLQPGMVLARDIVSRDAVVLLAAGRVLDADLIPRISAYATRHALDMEIGICRPVP